jgi:hypothetical protein
MQIFPYSIQTLLWLNLSLVFISFAPIGLSLHRFVILHRFALTQNPEIFLKVLLCPTFKNISVLLKASIGYIMRLS